MVNAALAGTPLFETLATSNTDMKHGYIFLVRYDADGASLDAMLDISETMHVNWVGRLATQKLTGETDIELSKLYHAVSVMGIRVKMDGAVKGPYIIRSPIPISSKMLQTIIADKSREELKEFLKAAKV